MSTPLTGIPGYTPLTLDPDREPDFESEPEIPATGTDYEALIERAKRLPGMGRHVASIRATIREREALVGKIAALREAGTINPHNLSYIPSNEAKIKAADAKLDGLVQEINEKSVVTGGDAENREIMDKADALITIISNSMEVDVTPEHLITMALPEFLDYFRCRGNFYRRVDGNKIEQVVEEELSETMLRRLTEVKFGRIVGTAIRLCEINEAPLHVAPVLKNWSMHLRTYRNLQQFLPSDETMIIADWYMPIVADGEEYVLNRRTGKLSFEPDEDVNVLYPSVTVSSQGESRALDALVAHHFQTQEEIDAFYTTCGLSLFGYGIPNLVFLLGHGGSGKDALFSLMRAVHGKDLVCTLNALALMGHDEANDLVRLQTARLALCSFESSHHSDGAFKPAVLKSITSGGANPLTARAKYAKAAVDIYFRGSLWLYGNRVPNLTGGGDFDGLDRRFMILPMTRKLPEIAPPTGFSSWPEATVACAPVFAYRCLKSFMEWHEAGQIGYSDVRRRMPREWRELSNEHLVGGSRFGFLRDLFMPDPNGIMQETVLDVMGAIMKQEGMRVGRSRFLDVLRDTLSQNARFEDHKHLEARTTDGKEYLPITVVPSVMRRLLDGDQLITAQMALGKDKSWDPNISESAYKFNREAQLRAKLYGEDRG